MFFPVCACVRIWCGAGKPLQGGSGQPLFMSFACRRRARRLCARRRCLKPLLGWGEAGEIKGVVIRLLSPFPLNKKASFILALSLCFFVYVPFSESRLRLCGGAEAERHKSEAEVLGVGCGVLRAGGRQKPLCPLSNQQVHVVGGASAAPHTNPPFFSFFGSAWRCKITPTLPKNTPFPSAATSGRF